MTRTEILAVAKPMLFNTEMVKAILDGRKTVTRRVLKNQDKHAFTYEWNYAPSGVVDDIDLICEYNGKQYALANKPPCYNGDILYVRETWCEYDTDHVVDGQKYAYRADATPTSEEARKELGYKWKPSIHMPKEAARIFLRVTNVRVERLQDIITGDYRTPGNINKEGLYDLCLRCTHHNGECEDFIREKKCRLVDSFIHLWNSTIKYTDLELYGWEANPWVWAIEFERMDYVENPLYVPAADVAPVKHGKWIEYQIPHYFKCSECKCTVPYVKAVLIDGKRKYNYCPACGAKMDGERISDDED